MGDLVKELVIGNVKHAHKQLSLTFAFVSLFIKAPYLKKRDIHIKVIFEEKKDVENSTEKRERLRSREKENHSRKTIDERESPNITNTQHQRPHTHTGRSESTTYTQWKGLGYSIQYTATHHTML